MDVLDDAAWNGPSGVPDTTLAKGVHPHDFILVASGRADAATMGLDPKVNVYLEA